MYSWYRYVHDMTLNISIQQTVYAIVAAPETPDSNAANYAPYSLALLDNRHSSVNCKVG